MEADWQVFDCVSLAASWLLVTKGAWGNGASRDSDKIVCDKSFTLDQVKILKVTKDTLTLKTEHKLLTEFDCSHQEKRKLTSYFPLIFYKLKK